MLTFDDLNKNSFIMYKKWLLWTSLQSFNSKPSCDRGENELSKIMESQIHAWEVKGVELSWGRRWREVKVVVRLMMKPYENIEEDITDSVQAADAPRCWHQKSYLDPNIA